MRTCVTEVSEKLKDYNTEMHLLLFLNGKKPRPLIAVEKLDPKNKKKPINVLYSFCPFCGEEYSEATK